MMHRILLAASLCTALILGAPQAHALSGRVIDNDAKPLAGARVFAEPGLASNLAATTTAPDGTWRLEGLSGENIGVFAMAPGLAFGGLTVKNGQASDGIEIRLLPPGTISGKVVDPKGHEIPGAHITRIGLLGADKVGIPLNKLKAAGVEPPITDAEGRFTVPNLPAGGAVAIKVTHPDYAQEAADNIPVGEEKLKVTLYQGISVRGDVRLRQQAQPVADATVMVRSAQPPHDTAVTRTDSAGVFILRLKPGIYMCQASGGNLQSAGWTRVALTGESPVARLTLHVGLTGAIQGRVQDAKTGKPLAGVALDLLTEGNMAAVARTDAEGNFKVTAMAGENHVRIQPPPGYLPPEQPALRVQVPDNKTVTLPDFWLAPSQGVTVKALDNAMKPVPGAAIALLHPAQVGRVFTGSDGAARLAVAAWPQDGSAFGIIEHPAAPQGALFAVKKDAGEATVQLFPYGAVTGRVVDTSGNPVPGIPVAALYAGSDMALWRTVTDNNGHFQWDWTIPQVPLQCVTPATDATSEKFSVEPGGKFQTPDITVPVATPGISLKGAPLDPAKFPHAAGPAFNTAAATPTVLLFCPAADAPVSAEALDTLRRQSNATWRCAVIVPTPPPAASYPVPVLTAKCPATAATYIINPAGIVTLETFGLPPLRLP